MDAGAARDQSLTAAAQATVAGVIGLACLALVESTGTVITARDIKICKQTSSVVGCRCAGAVVQSSVVFCCCSCCCMSVHSVCVCVCVCVRACVRACERACACVHACVRACVRVCVCINPFPVLRTLYDIIATVSTFPIYLWRRRYMTVSFNSNILCIHARNKCFKCNVSGLQRLSLTPLLEGTRTCSAIFP